MLEITIKGKVEEVAALVLAIQERLESPFVPEDSERKHSNSAPGSMCVKTSS